MASRRDRIFAWVGLVVVVVSAAALTIAVIIQQVITDRAQSAAATATQQTAASSCNDTSTNEPTATVPTPFMPSGPVSTLQATDITTGSGAVAKAGDCLVVKYYGTLAATGAEFDENFTKTTAFAFRLGAGQVISGWDQGLVGLRIGGVLRLVIPSSLAYGS